MLSTMRQHSRSLLIYILFGIVIAVFIINFGPSSQGQGCTGGITQSYAARVGSYTVPEQDFRHAFQLLRLDQEPPELARARRTSQTLMEFLIRRELLAQEAERLGFRVSDEEIANREAQGHIVVVQQPLNLQVDPRFFSIFKDGVLDYEKWRKNFCEYFLHTTPKKFDEEQRRELLAEKVRDLFRAATKISPEEVRRDYVDHNTKVKLGFVRFSSRRLQEELKLDKADVDAYLAKHKDEIKKKYEAESYLYKGVPKEARIRVLVVPVAKDAAKEAQDKAQARATSALARIKGGADFAKVAQESGDDSRNKRGGLLGWRRKGGTGLGNEFDDKVFALGAGQLSGVIQTGDGFAVAKIEAVREGDLSLDAVQSDIAEELLRKERGADLAKREAEAAIAKVKAGAKLEDLFPKQEKSEDEADSETKGEGKADGAQAAAKPAAAAAHKTAKMDPNAPKLAETALFARRGNALEDIGVTKEGAQKVFGTLKQGETGGPFAIEGPTPTWVIVKVEEREDADLGAFDKRKDEITQQVAAEKWATVLNDWLHKRCVEAKEAQKIHVNMNVVAGEGEVIPYEPCMGFR